ncbi:MAG: hypothetical protein IJZ90_02545, partial [Clostridia bacterium]|nr:hypothetical protein [Clostridia bacterium]
MSKDNLYIKRNKGLGGKSKTIILVSILILSIALVVFLGILVFGSGDDGEGKTIGKLFSSDKNGTSSNEKGNNGNSTEEPEATQEPYAPIVEDAVTVGTRFNPPEGYERVELEEGSFGEYLRNYALKPYGTVAFLYDDSTGSYIENTEASTVGVFQQPNALNRWQQCADSIAMLYAEYLYENQ